MENSKITENFMLVLREFEGERKEEFSLAEFGEFTFQTNDGIEHTSNLAWYKLIGDILVRFVIDSPESMSNISMAQFNKLGLSPEQAIDIALANIRARYGEPTATPFENGVQIVRGKSSDVDSSYFLDYPFWNNCLGQYPEGVVVGVPKRGGLIFAPKHDIEAVAYLESNIHGFYKSSENLRVSSGLYSYDKKSLWKIHHRHN